MTNDNNHQSSDERFDSFVSELRDLCRKHWVVICSSGYESLEVWGARDEIEHEDPIYCGDIQNCIPD